MNTKTTRPRRTPPAAKRLRELRFPIWGWVRAHCVRWITWDSRIPVPFSGPLSPRHSPVEIVPARRIPDRQDGCVRVAHPGSNRSRSERHPGVVLAPTRELADQVKCEAERLAYTSPIRVACFVGQRDMDRQIRQLERGVQVAVGTPGRVKDLNNRGHLIFENPFRVVVLDEAARMLESVLTPEIRDILRRCPNNRQTLLLSATLPPSVERLAKKYMRNPRPGRSLRRRGGGGFDRPVFLHRGSRSEFWGCWSGCSASRNPHR
ncbi:MAG: hypothetical protein CM1200mP2_41940 [Planctomycetaceae bacterium]|nr:MAG: hypothetical protein CM1200mP2_41940 [Planctomycetaceae bacterium]